MKSRRLSSSSLAEHAESFFTWSLAIAVLSFAAARPLLAQDERSISIDLTRPGSGTVSTVSASAFHIRYAATDAARSSHIDRLQGVSRAPLEAARPQAAMAAAVPSVPSP